MPGKNSVAFHGYVYQNYSSCFSFMTPSIVSFTSVPHLTSVLQILLDSVISGYTQDWPQALHFTNNLSIFLLFVTVQIDDALYNLIFGFREMLSVTTLLLVTFKMISYIVLYLMLPHLVLHIQGRQKFPICSVLIHKFIYH